MPKTKAPPVPSFSSSSSASAFELKMDLYRSALEQVLTVPSPRKTIWNVNKIRETIYDGFGKEEFNHLKNLLDVSNSQLVPILHTPERTLSRRKKFDPSESERILILAAAFSRAIDVLGTQETARDWFKTKNRAFSNKTPLEMCDTSIGAQAVEDLLGRLEHGVFS